MNLSYTLYNIVMRLGKLWFAIVRRMTGASGGSGKGNLTRFAAGQAGLLDTIGRELAGNDGETIWVHVASLGEYAVARPIIRQLRSENRTIVLTVFSPSAYDILSGKRRASDGPHHVFHLPWDTPGNAKTFLDAVRPAKAIFIISEYWMNYLRELKRRHTPTCFVSSLIPDDSYLLKWYGRPFRKAIPQDTCFMVADETSAKNLRRMGFGHVRVTGDPLFDNAIAIARRPYHDDIVSRFCSESGGGVLVAGSISDDKDLKIVSSFANTHRHVKCIFVPHEISQEKLNNMKYHLEGSVVLYSDCTTETDFSQRQVLIIDFIGALASLYRYGRWAYVGGGFTPYLHSVIEPLVYGLPVAFGPCIQRKVTPRQMMELGIGKMVRSAKEFADWMDILTTDAQEMERIRQQALRYAESNGGATMRVVQAIGEK